MSYVFSNYAGNAALNLLLCSGPRWLALHETDPTVAALLATEVAGGDYERQPIKFSTPSGQASASTNAQRFPGMPACIVRFLAVWDQVSNGNMIYVIDLSKFGGAITVADTAAFDAAPGDVAVSFPVAA